MTQETPLRVLDKLDTFEGCSQLTCVTYKIAVRIALSELRRESWKDISLDEMAERGRLFLLSANILGQVCLGLG